MLDMIRMGGDSYPRPVGIRRPDPEEGAVESRLRLLTIACAVVFLAGVVATFTVDGDDGELASADSPTTTAGDDVDTDGSTTTAKPKAGSGADDSTTTTTTEAGSSTTTTAPATSTTTTEATTTTAPPTTQPERTPTTPGTYTYDVDGCCDENGNEFSGTSELTVEPVAADGTQKQTQQGPDGTSTTVYRYAPEGTYLVSMQVSSPQGSFTLRATAPGKRPEEAFLLIPADVSDGTQTSGRLTDGDITADVTFTAISVGPTESTAEIHADLYGQVSIFNVEGTMDSTIRARSRDQLPLETTSTTDITKPQSAASTTTVHSVLRQ